MSFFHGGHILTALGGIFVGLALLYIPDGDLKEILTKTAIPERRSMTEMVIESAEGA